MGKSFRVDCSVNGRVPAHLLESEVIAEVNRCYGVTEISDAAAVTIASWWQSPGTDGIAFAELSTSGKVDIEDLSRAIGREYNAVGEPEQRCFDMLSTWALNHASRDV